MEQAAEASNRFESVTIGIIAMPIEN